MSLLLKSKKTDKEAHNKLYFAQKSRLLQKYDTPSDYIEYYEANELSPFYKGGNTKGYVRGLAVSKLLEESTAKGLSRDSIIVMDAGCGLGKLSIYLACIGFKVLGVDISVEACQCARELARYIGISNKCIFLNASLDDLPIVNSSIDFIIGHASLHHFIKYNVASEFNRIMKTGARGFFADTYGENPIYHIFHNKIKMEQLGDIILTKTILDNYLNCFQVDLIPTDWFVMLDKLYLKYLPKSFKQYAQKLSKVHFWIDRMIPRSNRVSLFLSGSVMTTIAKNVAVPTALKERH